MLSEGGPCNYDRGARILHLESENEYLRKKLNDNNNNNGDDWFIVLIFMVAISIKVFL